MIDEKLGRLPLKVKIYHGLGNLGMGFVLGIHMLYLVYFFFPPKDVGIPYVIPQGSLIFGLTVLGLICALGRLVDAVTDPLIATWNDNCKHPKGKRTLFMRRSALGFAATYALVFFTPITNSIHGANIVWIACLLALGALFQTLYIIPYNSLIVDIAKHPDDKIDIATIGALLWFSGFLVCSFSGSFWNIFVDVFDMTLAEGMKYTFVLLCTIGFVFMMVPGMLIDETKYQTKKKKVEKIPFKESVKTVLENKNFCINMVWITLYGIATGFFEGGLIYYITVLALLEAQAQGPLTIVIGGITFISYPFVNHFAKKKGKKLLVGVGFILFFLMFLSISILGLWGIPIYLVLGLVIVFAPLPQSIFGMLPGAMNADCAAWGKKKTGKDVAAMYMAVGGFISKLAGTLTSILFTSLLLFGKDIGDDLGVRLLTITGAIICVIGFLVSRKYNEKEIMSYIED